MPDPVRLHTSCPYCGTRPRLRVYPAFAELLGLLAHRLGVDLEEEAQSYQCHVRGCNRIYDVSLAALARLPPAA